MKKTKTLCILATAILSMAATMKTDACTNIIVTKGASADGSILVSYAADSHTLFGELYFAPAADWKAGTTRKIYDWDSGRYLGEIPQPAHTYKRVGNMNEHQLIIAETTFGGRSELHDRNGGIDYGSLIYVALERCKTAREAITLMTDLANEYGYYSEGESFTIADKNEVWIMEMIGKGTVMKNGVNLNKGVVWVAVKIPDGYISAHANQARITTFPLKDPENCRYSPDVISFAKKKGYYEGPDDEFSFADAYCPLDFGALRACEARVWSAFNILSNGWFTAEDENGRMVTKDAYTYIDYAMGQSTKNRMPLYIQPAKKLTVKDIADVMRDHYEGTPMDMTQDIGAGGNGLPYRWRPMSFSVEGKTYINERAIATQQTGFWFVGQSRSNFPDVIGGIIWFGTDDAATSYLTPIYTNTTKVPKCFQEGNGDILTYSESASFWINNRVSNACYKMYNIMAPYVRERIDKFEKDQLRKVFEIDNEALDLYLLVAEKESEKAEKKGYSYDPKEDTGEAFAAVKRFLTNYSVETAQNQFSAWRELEKTLLVKYIDGNVKAQNEDGSFKHSEFSTHLPDGITNPGYTDLWKQTVVEMHGSTIEQKTAE
jgi:dipeptidase